MEEIKTAGIVIFYMFVITLIIAVVLIALRGG